MLMLIFCLFCMFYVLLSPCFCVRFCFFCLGLVGLTVSRITKKVVDKFSIEIRKMLYIFGGGLDPDPGICFHFL